MPNQPTLRDVIKEEYKKCLQDPVYFIRKYVKIQTQDKGIIPFDLFNFQEKLLNDIDKNDRIVILKSRQMGISTLIAAYALWMMIFNEGKNILVVSIKEITAKEIISKIKLANENLPSWLKVPSVEYNMHSIKLQNKSMVMATSSASDSTRSFSASFIIFDECAFIPDIEELWTSAQPTLSTVNKGKAIILSTPGGVGNFFHKTWVDAEKKKNGFYMVKLPWNLRPDRDENWKNKQIKELGVRLFGQEYNCDFLSSGTNVVDLMTLKWYEDNPEMIMDRIEARKGEALWIFREPKQGQDYLICADVARGDASDFSAAHVFDVETLEQVAEFQDQLGTREFGDILVTLATEYNDALLVVERENIGWAVLQQIIDRQYKNTFYSNTNDPKIADVYHNVSNRYHRDESKLLPGFSTTIKTRPLLVSKIEEYFREKLIIIHSIRLINELKTFIWENGKAQAAQNYNDDLVLALGIGLWVRDTALRLRSEKMVLTRTMLDKIHIGKTEDKTPIYTVRTPSKGKEQWQLRLGNRPGDVESLTWLLR
jgi:hypothetical protein